MIQNITPTSDCPDTLELAITFATEDENSIFQHSDETPANGLCGYLAYYQLIQNILLPDEYIASPDLADVEQLKRFKAFYEEIDETSFNRTYDDKNIKFRHESLIDVLNRLLNDTDSSKNEVNNYKRNTNMLAEKGWCSTKLMMKYDKKKLSNDALRVLANFDSNSKKEKTKYFFFQFHANSLKHPLRLPKTKCNDLLDKTKYMVVLNDKHFYLAPFPLKDFDLSAKFDEYWELLKLRIKFFKELKL